MRRIFSSIVVATLALGTLAQSAQAQSAYLSSNRLGYTGTVTRFTSFADALFSINGTDYAVPDRDLGMFMIDDNPGFSGVGYPPSAFDFLSFWYSTPSSPSNTNTGFIQISDEDGGSVVDAHGRWIDGSMTSFEYEATGGLTTPTCAPYTPTVVEDCPRLWNAGSPLGSAETTLGSFLNYDFYVQVGGLVPATFNAVTGAYESNSDPTSAFGFFSGLFYNDSFDDPSSNGFYRVNLELNLNSWAALQDQNTLDVSAYGSVWGATEVPEPATYALLLVGIATLGFAARRRRTA